MHAAQNLLHVHLAPKKHRRILAREIHQAGIGRLSIRPPDALNWRLLGLACLLRKPTPQSTGHINGSRFLRKKFPTMAFLEILAPCSEFTILVQLIEFTWPGGVFIEQERENINTLFHGYAIFKLRDAPSFTVRNVASAERDE